MVPFDDVIMNYEIIEEGETIWILAKIASVYFAKEVTKRFKMKSRWVWYQGPLLATWLNFNSSMYK